MKKLILILMAALMLLSLCACGSDVPQGDDTLMITAKPKVETTEGTEETEPMETTETTIDASSAKELAISCIDKDVSELYALIGEPQSSDYAPSCLVDGDDGMLYYEGFVVYTNRLKDGTETVYYVE